MYMNQTYKQRYEYWYNSEITYNVEYEIISRLLCGKTEYQRMILEHTCKAMFTEKKLRTIYEIITDYVKTHGIAKLNAMDLICTLDDTNIQYTGYIYDITKNFIISADSSNLIMCLISLYEKRLLNECKTREDFESVENEISKYKFMDTTNNLFDIANKYLLDYETQGENITPTYYPSIDNLIDGLQGGNYMILAGSTGMGKTVMALNIALSMAKHNKKVLYFSMEMTPEELISRIIANEANISAQNLRNYKMEQQEVLRYTDYIASAKFNDLQNKIIIPKINDITIKKIEEIARNTQADIIFIDYLGLIRSDNNKSSIYEQVSDISRRLKLLAMETKKPFIILHQLNRDVKNRQDKHPTLSDLRDSGKIEQDADFITFVYRPAYYDKNQDKTRLEFILAKSRHTSHAGETALLKFDGIHQRITDTQQTIERGAEQWLLNF